MFARILQHVCRESMAHCVFVESLAEKTGLSEGKNSKLYQIVIGSMDHKDFWLLWRKKNRRRKVIRFHVSNVCQISTWKLINWILLGVLFAGNWIASCCGILELNPHLGCTESQCWITPTALELLSWGMSHHSLGFSWRERDHPVGWCSALVAVAMLCVEVWYRCGTQVNQFTRIIMWCYTCKCRHIYSNMICVFILKLYTDVLSSHAQIAFSRFCKLAFFLCSFTAENFVLVQGLSSTTAEHQGANFRSLLAIHCIRHAPKQRHAGFNDGLPRLKWSHHGRAQVQRTRPTSWTLSQQCLNGRIAPESLGACEPELLIPDSWLKQLNLRTRKPRIPLWM